MANTKNDTVSHSDVQKFLDARGQPGCWMPGQGKSKNFEENVHFRRTFSICPKSFSIRFQKFLTTFSLVIYKNLSISHNFFTFSIRLPPIFLTTLFRRLPQFKKHLVAGCPLPGQMPGAVVASPTPLHATGQPYGQYQSDKIGHMTEIPPFAKANATANITFRLAYACTRMSYYKRSQNNEQYNILYYIQSRVSCLYVYLLKQNRRSQVKSLADH